jgi:hypothetical protein
MADYLANRLYRELVMARSGKPRVLVDEIAGGQLIDLSIPRAPGLEIIAHGEKALQADVEP